MREITGNLWTISPVSDPLIVRVITTNGTVKQDGRAVMGRGVAYQALKYMPTISLILGEHITRFGNVVWGPKKVATIKQGILDYFQVAFFPVKHNWWENADLKLITHGAYTLRDIATLHRERTFILPRPGCGNGNLDWNIVKNHIKDVLPSNVTVISR